MCTEVVTPRFTFQTATRASNFAFIVSIAETCSSRMTGNHTFLLIRDEFYVYQRESNAEPVHQDDTVYQKAGVFWMMNHMMDVRIGGRTFRISLSFFRKFVRC
jgi:hypothetical protein